jgi:hypothetical protein
VAFYQLKVDLISTVLGISWVEVPNDSGYILGISGLSLLILRGKGP